VTDANKVKVARSLAMYKARQVCFGGMKMPDLNDGDDLVHEWTPYTALYWVGKE